MRARFFLVLAALAVAATSFGADSDVEELLGKMRDAYKAVKTAKLEVALTINTDDDKKVEGTAKVEFANPKKAKIDFTVKDPDSSDSKTVYYIQNGEKMAGGDDLAKLSSDPYEEEALNLPVNLETISFWQYEKQLSTKEGANMHDSKLAVVKDVEWNDKKWITLEETAKEVFVRYYIDPDTKLIWRCEVKDVETMKPQMDVQIKKLDTGVDIDDKDFKID